MKNIKKYKDEIIEEYQNLLKNFQIDGDGNRMNKAIQTIAFKHCEKRLLGASSTFKWLCEEYKEPVLDDVEKEYLSAAIRPFRKMIAYIVKAQDFDDGKQCIRIILQNGDGMHFPYLDDDEMYKGMEVNKDYSLEELGL